MCDVGIAEVEVKLYRSWLNFVRKISVKKKPIVVIAVPDWRVSDGNPRTSPSGIIVATTPVSIAA
jgi:hypothetical protein